MKLGALAVALALAGVAHADPDPPAQRAAEEANLESNAPRQGVTLAGSLGGGLLISKGTVAEIPVLSLRLGHVVAPSTVITFELTGGTYVHKPATSTTSYDQTVSALVGAQQYIGPSLWVRFAGGLNVHTIDNGMSTTVRPGPGGMFGVGLDLVVRHLWRLGLEGYGLAAIDRDGLLFTSMLGLGLSHY